MSDRQGGKVFKKRADKLHKKNYKKEKALNKEPQTAKREQLMTPSQTPQEGTVEFLNINMLKKNSVRGLLKKRAKKYDCKELFGTNYC